MPGPAWNADPVGSEAIIAANLPPIYAQLAADAVARPAPSLTIAADWHRRLYNGVSVPSPSYLGNPRDSDPAHPDLLGYEVVVGPKQGVPSQYVPDELNRLIEGLQQAVDEFDLVFPVGQPATAPTDVFAVVELAARAHGEWVRIHPFANGNGRTARLWANWIAVRYELPPFVSVRPRPAGTLYERAAAASMGSPPAFQGDHAPTIATFIHMLSSATT